MNAVIFACYALIHAALFVWAWRNFLRWREPATVPLLLVTAGLVYDNSMIAVGDFLGEGTTLAQLSVPRFFMHAMTTPLLILTALGMVQRTGAEWARNPFAIALAASLTVAMIIAGFGSDMVNLTLESQREGGLLSYGNANAGGVPIAPTVTTLVLLAAGIIVWMKDRVAWLTLGSIGQFAAAALGGLLVALGNLGEVLLLAGLVATDWQQTQRAVGTARASG